MVMKLGKIELRQHPQWLTKFHGNPSLHVVAGAPKAYILNMAPKGDKGQNVGDSGVPAKACDVKWP